MADKEVLLETTQNGNDDQLAITRPVDYIEQYRNDHKDLVMTGNDMARNYTYDPATWTPSQPKESRGRAIAMGLTDFATDIVETPQQVYQWATGGIVGLKKTFFPNMDETEFERTYRNVQRKMNKAAEARAEEIAKTGYPETYEWTNAIGTLAIYIGTGGLGAAAGAARATSKAAAKSIAKGAGITARQAKNIAKGAKKGAEVAVGTLAGVQTTGQLSQEFAQQYASDTGDVELKNYNPGKDFKIAGLLGGISAFVNTKLDVARYAGRFNSEKGIINALKQGARAGTEEFVEESIESITQDFGRIATGYKYDLTTDDILTNALTNGIMGAVLGGPAGAGLYAINRRRMISRYMEKGLSENTATQVADQILTEGRSQVLDQINTNYELATKNGEAYTKIKNIYTNLYKNIDTANAEELADTYARMTADWLTIHADQYGLPTSLFIDANEAMDNMVALRQFTPQDVANRIQSIKKELAHQKAIGEASNQTTVADLQRKLKVLTKVNNIYQAKANTEKLAQIKRNAQIDDKQLRASNPELTKSLKTVEEAKENQRFVYVGEVKLPVEYKVVDISEVKQSHINGEPNAAYTNKELQNRTSRGTQADVTILKERANNIRAYELLDSYNTQTGAPIVNDKGEVIAGNGRTEIVRMAYESGKAEEYKKALVDAGYNIEGKAQPILVRQAGKLTDKQQIAIADASNVSTISAFDRASRANQDSKYIEGTTDSISFAGKLPITDRQGLMLNNGQWDINAVDKRYQDALLAWLCGNDEQLFQKLQDTAPKKVMSALATYASKIYDADKIIDIRSDIFHALQKLTATTKANFIDTMAQPSLESREQVAENVILYNFLFEDEETIGNFISEYITRSTNNASTESNNLLGEQLQHLSKKDLVGQSLRAVDAYKIIANPNFVSKFAEDEMLDPNMIAAFMSYQNQFGEVYNQTVFHGATRHLIGGTFNDKFLAAADRDNPAYKDLFYQGNAIGGWYDAELATIALGRNFNELTLAHELAHHWLTQYFNLYKQYKEGTFKAPDGWVRDAEKLFSIIGIEQDQAEVTREQQEKWATMNEAYLTGFVPEELKNNISYRDFQRWIPEKYKSILQIGYLDQDNNVINPILSESDIEFFNKWYAHPDFTSLHVQPEAQKWAEKATSTKVMNDREKTIAQDWEEQESGIKTMDRIRNDNIPTDLKAAVDAEEVRIHNKDSQEIPNLPEHKSFSLFGAKNAQERMADIARNYVQKNIEHAKEIAMANPLFVENDTGVDREFLILAVIEHENYQMGSPEYAQLMHNAARTRQIAGSTLGLHNTNSFKWYIDAINQIEETLENKAAINYAGKKRNAINIYNADIERFVLNKVDSILATAKESKERDIALAAMFAEAKTKFSGNVSGTALTQLDLTGKKATRANKQAFIEWAKREIKRRAGVDITSEMQVELLQVSQKAQQAETELDSQDEAKAIAAAKTIREWQNKVNSYKKTDKGKVGRFFDSVFGEYAPRAMLFSPSTLLANIPGNVINGLITSSVNKVYGKNKVSQEAQKAEIHRLKQINRATGMNFATMEKPTSPSILHGEKYKQTTGAIKAIDPFTYLSETDNLFRIPIFVDTLARIATKHAEEQGVSPTELFRQYCKLHNEKGSVAQQARLEAIEIGNIAVFTQNGMLAKMANKIRDALNVVGTGNVGLGNLISPFVKTPANIVEMGARAIAFPVTGWKTLLNWNNATDKAKFDFALDGATLALSALATVLMSALQDDREWYAEPYKSGKYDSNKPYDSIRFGKVWIRLDQFGTLMLPMQVGAKLVKDLQDGKAGAEIAESTGWQVFSELLRQTPVIDTFQENSMKWAATHPGQYALNYAYNQANKLVPAWGKQIARPTLRESGIVLTPESKIGKRAVRNYGLDGQDNTINDWLSIIYGRLKVEQ